MGFTPTPPLKAGLFGNRTPGGLPPLSKPPPKPAHLPGGIRVEHRIGVQAPAEVIWAEIADLEAWHEWNPLYPQASGKIRIGGTLDLTLALEGQPPQAIKPVVLDWAPNEQLLWRLKLLGGTIRTTRYIEIEALGPENCIVSNGEFFGGLMGGSLVKRVGRSVRQGFEAMNDALKARAEAKWRDDQARPTSPPA